MVEEKQSFAEGSDSTEEPLYGGFTRFELELEVQILALSFMIQSIVKARLTFIKVCTMFGKSNVSQSSCNAEAS